MQELGVPHHDGSAAYRSPGPYRLGDVVRFRVLVPHADGRDGADAVVMRVLRDGEPHFVPATPGALAAGGRWWNVSVELVNTMTSYRFFLRGRTGAYQWLNAEGLHRREISDSGDFLLRAGDAPPRWVPDQIAYQIFPDRFARSASDRPTPPWADPADWSDEVLSGGPGVERQWFGGDLDGVVEHLDHLVELSAGVIYLTPVFEGGSNHRYDAVSFDAVDPVLGGDEALSRLIDAAHDRGIRVLGDLTTNHTGVLHEWFRQAQADPQSVEAGFYRFTSYPDRYESWLGVPSLPKLDHSSPELRRRFYSGTTSVVGRWIEAGLDGWRIDVANMTGRMGADDLAHEVARDIRAAIHAVNPEAWLLAEHGHDASSDLRGDGWDGAMDYLGFTRPVWAWLNGGAPEAPSDEAQDQTLTFLGQPCPIPVLDADAVVGTMREAHAAMPWAAQAASTLHLDSHDTPRFRTVAGGGRSGWVDSDGSGRERHLLGLALQMTMPGVPSIFAGDEIGLTGINGEHSRTPFPWDPQAWDLPTWDAYRIWTRLRHDHIALRRGGLRWVDVGTDSMTYLREYSGDEGVERLLVHVARASHPVVAVPLDLLGGGTGTVLVGEPLQVADSHALLPMTSGASVWSLPASDLEW